jgi:hypothetical protein
MRAGVVVRVGDGCAIQKGNGSGVRMEDDAAVLAEDGRLFHWYLVVTDNNKV